MPEQGGRRKYPVLDMQAAEAVGVPLSRSFADPAAARAVQMLAAEGLVSDPARALEVLTPLLRERFFRLEKIIHTALARSATSRKQSSGLKKRHESRRNKTLKARVLAFSREVPAREVALALKCDASTVRRARREAAERRD